MIMERYQTQSERIFHKYREKVFGFFVDFLSDRELARDLTQDIFVKILQRENTITNMEDIDGYVYQMCRNLAFDHLKKASYVKAYRDSILKEYDENQPFVNPIIHQKINSDHYQYILNKNLAKLPDQQQIIFNLSKKEGLSNKKIASQLNISPNTVRNHLYEAMKTLRSQISRSDIEILKFLPFIFWIF